MNVMQTCVVFRTKDKVLDGVIAIMPINTEKLKRSPRSLARVTALQVPGRGAHELYMTPHGDSGKLQASKDDATNAKLENSADEVFRLLGGKDGGSPPGA